MGCSFEIIFRKPKHFFVISIVSSVQYVTTRITFSHLLHIVVLGHGIIFTACINSESNIFQSELDTQVIKLVCLMQLVYPWIHLKLLLMCVSKMSDFYQNTKDSHPNVSTWLHIDMLVLHFFKQFILLHGMFVEAFSPIIIKKISQFADEISWNSVTFIEILIVRVQCFNKIISFILRFFFFLNL